MPPTDRVRDLDPGSIGVDVSHHQGEICWETVAEEDIGFAYIKATQGDKFRDTLWEKNFRGATASGLPVRSYHYADPYRSKGPDVEAAHYLSVVGQPQTAVLDWEGAALRLGGDEQADWIGRWLTAVDPGSMVVYCSLDTLGELKGKVSGIDWWVAWWDSSYMMHYPPPDHIKSTGAECWQFTSRGHVQGISGPVDMNLVL